MALFAGGALGQTASTALDGAWVTACATATQGTAFFDRCEEILNAGPGVAGRRSAAATGNNLEIFSTQGRLLMAMTRARARAARHASADAVGGSATAMGFMAEDPVATTLADGGHWSLFGSAGTVSSRREQSGFERGFEDDGRHLLLGLDYRFSPEWSGFAALQRQERDADFLNATGRFASSADSLSLGTSFNASSGFSAGLTVGAGRMDSDLRREIRYRLVLDAGQPTERIVDIATTALSDGGSQQKNVDAYVSWDQSIGGWSVRYGLEGSWQHADIDRVLEDNAIGLDFAVARQSVYSLQGAATLEFARAISTASGVIQPYARLRWVHEARDDVRRVQAGFRSGDNVFRLSFLTAEPDRGFGDATLGVVGVFPNGWQVYGSWQRLLAHEFLSENRFDIGWRREF